MTRQQWVRPMAMVQVFEANEYVAACYTINGTLQCVYPGDGSSTNGLTDVYDDYTAGCPYGSYTTTDGVTHDLCGVETPITIGSSNTVGYELYADGSKNYDRPIYGISGYTAEVGTYYGVTWKTQVVGGASCDIREHYGRLTITSVTESANRS